jgi:tRNA U34 5-methylaminomethyl-2-thiouridine-forming methyltransferase MnmC
MRAFAALETADGSVTFAHPVHGQTFHSRSGAWQEARERYAAACRLAERASGRAAIDLLDIGTGLGWNLAAALAAVDASGGTNVRLRATSLEHDVDVIRAVVDGRAFASDADADRWHATVRGALSLALADPARAGSADGVPMGNGSLRLCIGDARSTLAALEPDVHFDAVFLDPFSPAVESELWESEFLSEIARRMRSGAWLSTYTVSLPVRARLLAAGLRVGPGARVGAKSAGTIASPDQDPGPLDPRTARRVARLAAHIRGEFEAARGTGLDR